MAVQESHYPPTLEGPKQRRQIDRRLGRSFQNAAEILRDGSNLYPNPAAPRPGRDIGKVSVTHH